MAGDAASDELYAVKRMAFGAQGKATLQIPGQASGGQPVRGAMLHLVSGCYLGIDQQAWVART